MPIYQVITIANPPPRGVGIEWELLSLGTSRILFFKEILFVTHVSINETISRSADRYKIDFKVSENI